MVEGNTNVVFTNNTGKLLYPKEQHFWSGSPVTAPARLPPNSNSQGKQQATAKGELKFATVYYDNDPEAEVHPTTRKFISAFDIAAPQESGPYGSQLPRNYSFKLGPDEIIKEVIVRSGYIVDAIGFVIADKSGATSTKIFGGTGEMQPRYSKITLKSDEYITQISGTYGKYEDSSSDNNIATLSVHTNLKPGGYGPYGEGTLVDNTQNFTSTTGPIVGFFGTHDISLQSIGIYLGGNGASKDIGQAYAESGPIGPIDWNVVEVKLGRSQSSSAVYEDKILGGKVEATGHANGDADVIYSIV